MITEDVLAFLRSRPIAMIGTRDRKNCPYAHETFLVEIEADHVVAFVLEQFGRNLAQNVADNGDAALLVSRQPGDHRSVQLKGKITELEAARPRPELLAGLSIVSAVFRAFMPEEAVRQFVDRVGRQSAFRFRFDVAEVFDQSPGPGAGRRIGAGT